MISSPFRRFLQEFFKISSRFLQDFFKMSSRCFQDVSRRLQDVFKISSRRLQDVTKTSWMKWRSSIFWYSSGAILRNRFSYKLLWFVKNGLAVALPAKIFIRGVPTSKNTRSSKHFLMDQMIFARVMNLFFEVPSRFLQDISNEFCNKLPIPLCCFFATLRILTHSVVYAPVLQYCIVFPTVHNTVL